MLNKKNIFAGFMIGTLSFTASASDITIRFAAKGKSTTVEKVRVDNTTKGTYKELTGSDVLVLTIPTSVSIADAGGEISVSPNPVSSQASLSFTLPDNGLTTLKIIASDGTSVAERTDLLNAGEYTYAFGGLATGMYHAVVEGSGYTCSTPFVCEGDNSQLAYILQARPEGNSVESSLKSLKANITMAYSKGDVLKFTGTTGEHTAVITDSPTENKTITFEYIYAPVADFTLNTDIARVTDYIFITDKSTNEPTKLVLLTGNGHVFLQNEFVQGPNGLEMKYYYPTRGLYTLTLTASNSAGSSEISKTIKIYNSLGESGTVSDVEGNTYATIKYGTQTWMVQNLRTTKFNDGTAIPNVKDSVDWYALYDAPAAAYCNYQNSTNNLVEYGRLYNMKAGETGKLCPKGWHVPTKDEWVTLQNHLIAEGFNYDCTNTDNKIAKSMVSTTGWVESGLIGSPGNQPSHNNMAKFNAYPTGYRTGVGGFYDKGKYASWIFAKDFPYDNTDNTWGFYISTSIGLNTTSGNYNQGRSVRCVKD